MTFRALAFPVVLFLFVGLLATSARAQRSNIYSPSPAQPERLEHRSVPFSARRIDCEDSRFLVAASGFGFIGGVRMSSRDPALHSIAWFDGSTFGGLLRDGRAIVFRLAMSVGAEEGEIRVARTAEQAGGWTRASGREEAPAHPDIPGYRYVMSDRLVGTPDYLGLWRSSSSAVEALIVAFRPRAVNDPAGRTIIGRVPLALSSISTSNPLHGVSWDVALVSEAPVGRPIYFLHFRWIPSSFRPLSGTSDDDAARTTCRMIARGRQRSADEIRRGPRR